MYVEHSTMSTILDYYKRIDQRRKRLKNEVLVAISKLDQAGLQDLFLQNPSVTAMRLPGGGTLVHHLAEVDIETVQDEESAEGIMMMLHHWGVDFTASDNNGRRAGALIKSMTMYNMYIRLGGV